MRYTPEFLRKVLANEKIHAGSSFSGALDGLSVALSTVPLPTTGDIDFSTQVTLPTYTGYVDQVCAFGATHLNSNGNYSCDGPLLTFQQTGTVVTTTVQGFVLYLPGTPNKVYAAHNFDPPITLATVDDALNLVPQVALGVSDAGVPTVVS
jgi:hypothetical protein